MFSNISLLDQLGVALYNWPAFARNRTLQDLQFGFGPDLFIYITKPSVCTSFLSDVNHVVGAVMALYIYTHCNRDRHDGFLLQPVHVSQFMKATSNPVKYT